MKKPLRLLIVSLLCVAGHLNAGANEQGSGWFIKDGTSDNNSTFIFQVVGEEPDVPASEYYTIKGGARPTDISRHSLWYDFPATLSGSAHPWMEYGLPIGNGQIGATLLGGVLSDEFVLNEKTLYNGSPTDYGDHGTYACLGKIFVDDLSEMASTKDNSRPVSDYVRYLDIEKGVAGVSFSNAGGTRYERRYLVSAPHKVLAAHYKATGSDHLHLLFRYDPDGSINASAVAYKDGSAMFGGKLRSVSYSTEFRVVPIGGTIATTDRGIEVDGADEVTLFMTVATNFDDSRPAYISGTRADVATRNSQLLDAAVADGWEKVSAEHIQQFSELMGRVSLQLGDAASTLTTKDLVDNYAKAANRTKADGLFLEQLYFQYGRYLEVSCNNVLINAPANLQGIWNDNSNSGFWHCDIHADVNVQMNYWPAEITNLSEMHLPFLNNIITLSGDRYNYHRLARRYKSTARGWMLPTENNIFGGTSTWMAFDIKTLAAWNCSHLWQHYRYTLDRDFLKRALPAMLGAAQFLKDISTKASDGTYFVANEYSPEHGPSGHSTAFAQQNTAEVVRSIIEGAEVLGDESPIAAADLQEMRDFYDVLDKGLHTETYGGKTCLREWADLTLNSQGDAANHRHLSHLMALFPYGQLSAFTADAEGKRLYEAAVNSLHVRNATDVTGWSGGWKVNLHARALEGDEARKVFALMLKHSNSYVIAMSGQGGCYYNLWDAHSPFQIDGNFGYTSGVAEMLLQSYDGNLHLLPAVPTAWASGQVTGLKAVGDFTVDQAWADGRFTTARIVNNQGQPLSLTVGLLPAEMTLSGKVNGEVVGITENADGSYTLPTATAGDVVEISVVSRGGNAR
ncbi:MAG: glycoside hydrolase N-terminal domain-containing protein [Prevotella sp.]|nr:glycoside hydrolase N-terminal domain-containing protein [Prevotella sp.]